MVAFDDGRNLADRFRVHASLCSSPLYAELLVNLATDWEAGGVVRQACAGWEGSPAGSVVQLRLLAGVHRLVLQGRAPGLQPYYPSVGGREPPVGAWAVVRDVIAANLDELRSGLALAPQTNEVGRAAALAVGLLDAAWRSGLREIRLLEVGASAGLNLLVDRFRIEAEGWSWGPPRSPVRLPGAVVGNIVARPVVIRSRRGCDLAPVDASSPEGALLLSSYVWPDQLERFQRLQAALQAAAQHPVRVEAGAAGPWLERVLDEPVADRVLTVVWHSVTRMYWPPSEVARVNAAIARAGSRFPLAHVQLEYADPGPPATVAVPACAAAAAACPSRAPAAGPRLSVEVWRRGEPDGRRTDIAQVADHGVPVRLRDGVTIPP